MTDPPPTGRSRLRYVDALRGLASISVLFHHLLHNTVMEAPLRTVLPGAVTWLQGMGAHGVQVFFVLSGFVLTLSLQSTSMDRRATGRFIARRQMRLDPPYWLVIGLALGALVVESLLGFVTHGDLSIGTVVANLFYLQNILGRYEIIDVAWTLCLEIQFYLVLLILLLVVRVSRPRSPGEALVSVPEAGRPVLAAILAATGIGSLAYSWSADAESLHTWAFGTWHFFSMGALLFLTLIAKQRVAKVGLGILFALEVATLIGGASDRPSTFAGLLAVAFITTCHRSERASQAVGTNRPLQYVGSRSYSIYLVHLTVLTIVMRFGYRITGQNGWAAVGWMVLAAAVSLTVAEGLYRIAEKPAIGFSAQVRADGVASALRNLRLSAVAREPRRAATRDETDEPRPA